MVDTNIFIDLERRRLWPSDLARIYPDDSFSVSVITVSELWQGMYRTDSEAYRQRHETFVQAMLQAMEVVPFDLIVARHRAIAWTRLTRTGQMIKANDLFIAATALAYGFTVLTRDVRDFSRVPGLAVQVFEGIIS
jgi:tRNA(fMet)-specific endonuclease VapC